MGYKLRFVQTFDKKDSDAFLRLEQKFITLEENSPGMARGRRYVPVMGREGTNTLVWEADFSAMEDAVACLKALEENTEHDELFEEQVVYMRDAYVELYRELEGEKHD